LRIGNEEKDQKLEKKSTAYIVTVQIHIYRLHKIGIKRMMKNNEKKLCKILLKSEFIR